MTAPREDGWEELRREIEALPGDWDADGKYHGDEISRAAVLAIVDRLAATRGEPPEPAEHVHEGRWCHACVQHGSDVTLAGVAETEAVRRSLPPVREPPVTGVWSTPVSDGPSSETVEDTRPILERALAEGRYNVTVSGYEWRFQRLAAARGEPQENGWLDALSEASEGRGDWLLGWQAAIEAVRDRLAAARGEPPEPGPAIDVDSDAFRDDHERAIRAHILEGPEDHRCDDLCSAAIIDRLVGKHPINEYPKGSDLLSSLAALRDKP